MTIRLIVWIPLLAYVGFLWAGQGSRSFNRDTIIGAILGAVLGFCLAFIFTRRATRSALKFRMCLNRRAYFDVCGGRLFCTSKWQNGRSAISGCGSDDALRILQIGRAH